VVLAFGDHRLDIERRELRRGGELPIHSVPARAPPTLRFSVTSRYASSSDNGSMIEVCCPARGAPARRSATHTRGFEIARHASARQGRSEALGADDGSASGLLCG
jgi:hypothetical protein